jgi:hypothetical protein
MSFYNAEHVTVNTLKPAYNKIKFKIKVKQDYISHIKTRSYEPKGKEVVKLTAQIFFFLHNTQYFLNEWALLRL